MIDDEDDIDIFDQPDEEEAQRDFIHGNNVTPFHYKHQFRSVILQFMQMFAWMHVRQTGDDGGFVFEPVPVHYGLKDRVAAAILAGNTQNSVMRFPAIAVYLQGYELASGSLKGFGIPTSTNRLPYGGSFPEDMRAVISTQPFPMYLNFSVSIASSNLDEKYQILEQIMTLFSRNYQVQIQTSDLDIVSNKIVSVEMMGILNESTYPPSSERRTILHELQFRAMVYFTTNPIETDKMIKSIKVRIAAVDQMTMADEAAHDIESYAFNDYELVNIKDL